MARKFSPEHEAFACLAYRHTIGLSSRPGPYGKGRPFWAGSGVLLSISGGLYLATAAHVLRDIGLRNLAAYYPADGATFVYTTEAEFAEKAKSAPIPKFGLPVPLDLAARDVSWDDKHDVAVARISPRGAPQPAFPYDLSNAADELPAPNSVALMFAYPQSTSVVSGTKRVRVIRAGGYACIIDVVRSDSPDGWADGFDPPAQFEMHFDSAEIPGHDNFDLHGMSGGGIWRCVPQRRESLWFPTICLQGLQVSWRKESKLLKATGVKTIRKLVASLA